MSSLSVGPGFAYDNTLGAAFIGYTVSCVAFGTLLSQIAKYYSRYPADKIAYKLIVLVVGVIETADQILIAQALYHYTVSDYGNAIPFFFGKATWSLILQVSFGAFVGLVVKVCFALRVWRFSNHNIFITAFILLLCAGQFGLEVTFTVKCFILQYFAFLPQLKTLGTAALGCGVLADLVIAASLCYYLGRLKNGYRRNHVVTTLIVYAVNTGLLTSTISICTLIFYNLMPLTFIYIGFYFVLSKLYAISFLAALNTRKVVDHYGTEPGTFQTHHTPPDSSLTSLPSRWKSRSRLSSSIRQSREISGLSRIEAGFVLESPAPSITRGRLITESIPLSPITPSIPSVPQRF